MEPLGRAYRPDVISPRNRYHTLQDGDLFSFSHAQIDFSAPLPYSPSSCLESKAPYHHLGQVEINSKEGAIRRKFFKNVAVLVEIVCPLEILSPHGELCTHFF